MAKAPILCVLLGVAVWGIGAEGGTSAWARGISQEMLPLSSPVYEEMDILYLASGLGTPSDSRPWTKTEASLILSRVERRGLNDALANLWEGIEREIRPGL
ncbi:MAG TPA: hypothetical protein VIO60_02900, partial [Rectinemataceae bacterium]